MHATRTRWLSAAHRVDWFQLNRHDDPDPAVPPEDPAADPAKDPADPDPDPAKDPADDPEGAAKLGDEGKRALDRMKADRSAAKREAAAEKRRADELAAKVAEFEDRDKSELERATAKAERLEAAAATATARAVKAEVRALATGFTDIDDAVVNLQSKMAGYADADGNVDTDAIEADLAEVLERKPHLRKAAAAPVDPEKPKGPKPDPGQGARPGGGAADFRTASPEDYKAELAKFAPGFRPRT
ncbi:hypothetical protein ACI2LD_17815 [Enterococcus casseliflavus]|uniref:hypothetical protein n=1 Tax=Enterococcus casseliflavus TaxID=37734 RepID=UPI00384B89FE